MLEDTPEAMSKQIIDTVESLKKEHDEVVISNIVVHGDDLEERGKALNNILINECKRKNIHIINHSSIKSTKTSQSNSVSTVKQYL